MDQPGNHFLLRGSQPGTADRMRELLARTVQDHVTDQPVQRERARGDPPAAGRARVAGQGGPRARDPGPDRAGWTAWPPTSRTAREAAGLGGVARRAHRAAPRPGGAAGRAALAVADGHDVGVVAENVDRLLPRLQAVCDTSARPWTAACAGRAAEPAAAGPRRAAAEHGVGRGPVQPRWTRPSAELTQRSRSSSTRKSRP